MTEVYCCNFMEQILQMDTVWVKKEQLVVLSVLSYKIAVKMIGWKEQ